MCVMGVKKEKQGGLENGSHASSVYARRSTTKASVSEACGVRLFDHSSRQSRRQQKNLRGQNALECRSVKKGNVVGHGCRNLFIKSEGIAAFQRCFVGGFYGNGYKYARLVCFMCRLHTKARGVWGVCKCGIITRRGTCVDAST